MSPDLLQFLFLITSTAIVLGVAVTLRGLYGFVSEATPRLPASAAAQDGDEAGSSTSLDDAIEPSSGAGVSAASASAASASAASAPVAQPRDLREPLVMTVAGVFITAGALIALANLVTSA
jgi:hypothetical protein